MAKRPGSTADSNKTSPKSFGMSRVATRHGRKWSCPLRVLAVECPLQTSPITQPRVYGTSITQYQCQIALIQLARKLLRHAIFSLKLLLHVSSGRYATSTPHRWTHDDGIIPR